MFKKIQLQTATIGFLLLITACGQMNKNEQKKSNTIKKVTVAYGIGCESLCPLEALSIDSSLQLNYYVALFAVKYGYFKGTISRKTWDSIQTRFAHFISVGIDTTLGGATDHPEVEFYITDNIKKSHFMINSGKIKEDDRDILRWFMSHGSQNKNLVKCDSIPFETKIQRGIPDKFSQK